MSKSIFGPEKGDRKTQNANITRSVVEAVTAVDGVGRLQAYVWVRAPEMLSPTVWRDTPRILAQFESSMRTLTLLFLDALDLSSPTYQNNHRFHMKSEIPRFQSVRRCLVPYWRILERYAEEAIQIRYCLSRCVIHSWTDFEHLTDTLDKLVQYLASPAREKGIQLDFVTKNWELFTLYRETWQNQSRITFKAEEVEQFRATLPLPNLDELMMALQTGSAERPSATLLLEQPSSEDAGSSQSVWHPLKRIFKKDS